MRLRVGDFGSNLMLCIGTLYLLKFYTDELGMPAWYGGIIFLVAKFFTAFTDILTGVLLDSRRNIGAKGNSGPLLPSFPVAVVASAQFLATGFTLTVKTGLATVLFMLFGLFYSLMNCSYGAMVPAITKNPHERAQLAAWRQGGATVGLLLCTVGFMPIQALFVSSPSLGYLIAALLFSVCGLFSMWWCFSGVKERYIEIVPDHHKPSILKSFCAIFRNPPLLVLCVANLCTLAAFNIKLAIQVYYTQYVLNDIHLLSWMGFFSMGCILVGVLLVPAAVKRFGKTGLSRRSGAMGNRRCAELFWGSVIFIRDVFLHGLLRHRFCEQPELGAGSGYGRLWRMENGDPCRRFGIYGLYLFAQNFRGARWLPAWDYADANWLYPQHSPERCYPARFASAYFLWPCGLAIIAALTMGFFINSTKHALLLLLRN
jgi:GPH family glycoside/pentoside/hexuronide:cation symporter